MEQKRNERNIVVDDDDDNDDRVIVVFVAIVWMKRPLKLYELEDSFLFYHRKIGYEETYTFGRKNFSTHPLFFFLSLSRL